MKKIIISFFVLVSIIVISPTVHAQDFNFGEKADHESVEVNRSDDGKMFVSHVVEPSNSPQQLDLMDGEINNLTATDEDGNEKQVTIIGDNDAILILPSRTNSIVSYELKGPLEFKNDYWTLDFLYLESTKFFIPDDIESIYVNDRIVKLGEKKGFVCHGCQMILEYSFNEPKIIQNVKWEDQEFDVEIISFSKIDNFVFDQPGKSLSFDVSKENKFLTIVIPLELLWEPYTVFLDDEQIKFLPFGNNGTHVSLNMRPMLLERLA